MDLNHRDLIIDTYTATKAVRVTHIPTGISATFDEMPTARRNQEEAIRILVQKLYWSNKENHD